jgi:hypothetical protein
MKQTVQTVLLLATLIAGLSPAIAESYCVACYGPEAVYRCVVSGAPAGGAPDPRNQVQCIKQIAKADGHARCSVERFSTAGCTGPERLISPAAAAVTITPVPGETAGAAAGPEPSPTHNAPAVEPAAKEDQPPKTVEEMAKTTVENTKRGLGDVGSSVKSTTKKAGEQIEGVGSAIGDAAQQSWNCVKSLFSDC